MGTVNPALDDTSTVSTIRIEDQQTPHNTNNVNRDNRENDPVSPDSEFDEELGFPDSVTIVSMMGGDNPVLVQRKDNGDGDYEDNIDNNVQEICTEIPFISVYNPQVKFQSFHRKLFIPGVEINVEIIDHERNMTGHLLNPNL